LVFNLLDESLIIIDSTYSSTVTDPIILNIEPNPATPDFIISSDTTKIYFSEFFNISSLAVTGIPGSTISLMLSSTAIKSNS